MPYQVEGLSCVGPTNPVLIYPTHPVGKTYLDASLLPSSLAFDSLVQSWSIHIKQPFSIQPSDTEGDS